MATKIVTKNSSTASAVPTASDLVQGELAVNVADKRLFTEDNAGAIVELGTNPSGNVTFQDNGKAIFGAGSDLQIYHDGSNSYVKDAGTGTLNLQGSTQVLIAGANGTVGVQFVEGGGVNLRHNNSQKLATTSTGIDVTGTATADKVTIGTSSASNGKLTLEGVDGGDSAGIYFNNTTATNGKSYSLSSGNSGEFMLYDRTSDAYRLFVSSAGNVGIGASSPTSPLHIKSATNVNVRFDDSGSSSHTWYMNDAQNLYIPNVQLASTHTFYANGQRKVDIDSSGNVGIGTSSLTGGNTILNLSRTGSGAGCNMQFANSHNGAFYVGLAGNTSGDAILHSADGTAGMAFGTGNTERMRIDSSGIVLVGTDSVGYSGVDLTVGDTADSQNGLAIQTSTTGNGYLLFGDGSGAAAYRGQINYKHGDDYMAFHTANAEAMRIDSSGNLLVGTTSADSGSGNGVKIIPANGGANKPRVAISTAGYAGEVALSLYSTAVSAWRFYVQANGTISAVNTTITSLSDQRVKENVRDLDDGLAKVMQLQPRKFDWKEGKGKDISDDRGFIAQEFEQVFPDMISEWKDEAPEGEEAYKAINANLIPTLVKAIQEQQNLIESLTSRVAALEE